MAYKSTVRRLSKKSKRNFFVTLLIIGILGFITINWLLPNFIGGLGLITGILKSDNQKKSQISENPSLAPPVLVIPYEATNSAEVNISGYSTPGSKVKLFIENEERAETEVLEDGTFVLENIPLFFGVNNIHAVTLDEENKQSLPSKNIKVTLDDVSPKLDIFNPKDNSQQQGERKINIEGQTEPEASVFVNGSRLIVDGEGKFKSEQTLSDGENVFTIKAIDKASNSDEKNIKVTFTP